VATIRWTLRAQLDLQEIRNFAARSSPQNARALGEYILTPVRRLEDFPRSGRILPGFDERGLREVLANPYRILYIIRAGEVVEIQAIYHSSRNLRRILNDDRIA
jgi:plasmid stabilization system protein ParE